MRPRRASFIIAGLGALLVAGHAQTPATTTATTPKATTSTTKATAKGTMASSTIVNASTVDLQETTRTTAVQSLAAGASVPSPVDPGIDPGVGPSDPITVDPVKPGTIVDPVTDPIPSPTPDPLPTDPVTPTPAPVPSDPVPADPAPADGGTTPGTGTTTDPTPATGTTPATSPTLAEGDNVLSYIQSQDPGDTTVGYPPEVPSGTPWTGAPVTGTIFSSDDLAAGMAELTGQPATPIETPSAGGCKCCGAELETKEISAAVEYNLDIDGYIAAQIWHVDHYSGNFWNNYHHSKNTCVSVVLGDSMGTPLPAGTSAIPTVLDTTYNCYIPKGTIVDVSEGPPMPGSFTPPSVCPECGRHDDSWGQYVVATLKIRVPLHVSGLTPGETKWIVVCANGHDQALPCPDPATTTPTGPATPPPPTKTPCPRPTMTADDDPAAWQEYFDCMQRNTQE